MKLSTTFRGQDLLFEGDLPLLLRAIPAGAKITAASVTLTPKGRDADPHHLFHEVLPIAADTKQGEFGLATQSSGTNTIIDLGARRTIESVGLPDKLVNSTVTLQLDMGGLWLQLDENGNPAQPGATLPIKVNPAGNLSLPNIASQRLRLQDVAALTVDKVSLLSYPSNLTLRLGNLGPFWFRVGDLRQAITTPDFADILQGFLDRNQPEAGVFEVPFILHSDTLARLQLELNVKYYQTQALLPPALKEVVYPFGYGALPNAQPAKLMAQLPLNARALPGATSAQLTGRFEGSRVIHGAVSATTVKDMLRIKPGQSAAHPIQLAQASTANAIDLNIETVTDTAQLLVTLMEDVDGKPWGPSLLKEPIAVKTERPAAGGSTWVSAPLPAEFTFQANEIYWLIVNSAEGEVDWAIEPAGALPPLQVTKDDGLSWRVFVSDHLGSDTVGVYRLRAQLAQFRQPNKLDVAGHEVSLRSLDALGKVDFKLELPEVADALNAALADAAQQQAPALERVANGGFDDWTRVVRKGARVASQAVELEVSTRVLEMSTRVLKAAPDGSAVYYATIKKRGASEHQDVSVQRISNDAQPGVLLLSLDIPGDMNANIAPQSVDISFTPDGRIMVVVASYQASAGLSLNTGQADADKSTSKRKAHKRATSELTNGWRLWEVALDSNTVSLKATSDQSFDPKASSHLACDPYCQYVYLATMAHALLTSSSVSVPALVRVDRSRSRVPETLFFDNQTDLTQPISLCVSPDGRRAYVATASGIHVVDLKNWKWLRKAWYGTASYISLLGMSLSRDGKRLYVLSRSVSSQVDLLAIDTAALGQPSTATESFEKMIQAKLQKIIGESDMQLPAMSVTPDDTRLLIGDLLAGVLQVVDTTNPDALRLLDPIKLSGAATAAGRAHHVAIATMPDSRRTFVLSPDESSALQIQAIELDAWTANDWALTGGRVAPVYVPEAAKPTARLGSPTEATGLSQVFRVAGGQAYDLRFRARASDKGATAELFWLNDDCRLLDPLSIDIQVPACGNDLQPHTLRGTAPQAATHAELRFRQPAGEYMLLDDVSLAAPSEATLNSDFKTKIAVLDPTTKLPLVDPVTNQSIQRLQGWTAAPDATVLNFEGEGVRLNAPALKPATLSQDIVVQAGKPFTLHLQVYVFGKPSPKGSATAELRWVGSRTQPIKIELNQKQFDKQMLSGSVPADATGATLTFTQPPDGTLVLVRAQLSQPVLATIPITILSEAPGQVAVGAPVVAFDVLGAPVRGQPRPSTASPASPAAQPIGCKPTPPDDVPPPPGKPPKAGDGSFIAEPDPVLCPCCEGVHHLKDAQPFISQGGMSGAQGTCGHCGAEITGFLWQR